MNIKFTSINQVPISVKLIKIGLPSNYTINYKVDLGQFTLYTLDNKIVSEDGTILFEIESYNISGKNDSSNYFKFITDGDLISLSGNLDGCLIPYHYFNMFEGCKNIVDASNIITENNIGLFTFANTFKDCTSLKVPPVSLASGTLGEWCYSGMFNGCKSLTATPSLPSITLANNCYNSMFYNCLNLTNVSLLPATVMKKFCYNSMFNICSNLTATPLLPATELAEGCYKNMFMDCKNLKQISVDFNIWNLQSTGNWVKFVAPTGTFVSKSVLLDPKYGKDYIPKNWNFTTEGGQLLTFEALEDNVQIGFANYYNESHALRLRYKKNNQPFDDYTEGDIINLNQGLTVSFYSTGTRVSTRHDRYHKVISPNNKKFKVYGDLQALVNWTSGVNSNYQYFRLFTDTSVVDASELILPSSLQDYCFIEMFMDCASLTAAPAIPAKTAFQSYGNMFWGCSSLSTAPLLPASAIANSAYSYMFAYCTSLKTPPVLSATNLAKNCYNSMFYHCTSLTAAPLLPATSVYDNCYYAMFYNCSSLINAPTILPADIVKPSSYMYMFSHCTSLTTAPYLPATVLADSCYRGIFRRTSITGMQLLPVMNLQPRCYAEMYCNCSGLVSTVSILPATELKQQCYDEMFKGCSLITSGPQLPASTLANSCYYSMFDGCSNLTSISAEFENWAASSLYATTDWVRNIAPTGTFTKQRGLSLIYGNSNIPTNWNIINYGDISPYLVWDVDFTNGFVESKSHITGITQNPDNYVISEDEEVGKYLRCTSNGNQPLYWPGSKEYLASQLSGTDPFTFSFWLKAPKWDIYDNQGILDWRSGTGATFYRDGYDNNGPKHSKVNIRTDGNYWFFSNTNANYHSQWNHWVLVRDANGARWYCNGVLDTLTSGIQQPIWDSGQIPIQDTDITPNRDLIIGNNEWANMAYFDVTKYKIYKLALTSSDVYDLYLQLKPINYLEVPLTFKAVNQSGTIRLAGTYDETDHPISLLYKVNDNDWSTYTIGDIINLEQGDTVSFKGNNNYFNSQWNNRLHFYATGYGQEVYGNIMSLLTTNFSNVRNFPDMQDCTFLELFQEDRVLTGAHNLQLPATGLVRGCYWDMFKTDSLVTPPKVLPAIQSVEYCYHHMFDGAYSLTATPEVCLTGLDSAMDAHCMFSNCPVVESKVHFLDWDNVPGSIMFNGVDTSGIIYIPYEYTNTIPDDCIPSNWTIGRFSDTPLTFEALNNSSVRLYLSNSNYGSIYINYKVNDGNWTEYTLGDTINLNQGDKVSLSGANEEFTCGPNEWSVTKQYRFDLAGTLKAYGNIMSLVNYSNTADIWCFNLLFLNQYALVDISELLLPATNLSARCYQLMFNGCSLTAVPQILPATELAESCYQSMFQNCTSLTTVPSGMLPAMNLAPYCYFGTFAECTSLTAAPYLPATNLVDHCYYATFAEDSSLSSISVAFTDWGDGNLTEDWVRNVQTNSGTFYCPSNLDTTIFDDSHVPLNWTVINT